MIRRLISHVWLVPALAFIVALFVVMASAFAAETSYIYQKPLLENPTDAARLYIYDPVTNSDRNLTWGLLRALLLPSAPTWEQITGKPAEFPPGTHTQGIDTITGLQTALDSKTATTDPRLTDARVPQTHSASHAAAGGDPLTPASIGAATLRQRATLGNMSSLGRVYATGGISAGGSLTGVTSLATSGSIVTTLTTATSPIVGQMVASSGASSAVPVRISPSFLWQAQSWNTTPTASTRTNAIEAYFLPVSGAITSGSLIFANRTVDGVANSTELMRLSSSGAVSVPGSLSVTGNLSAGNLATVATSGSYNDLSNKPSIPAGQVNADWAASSGLAQILNKPEITRGYDGRQIELQTSATHIQWRYAGTATWTDLTPLSALTGVDGNTYGCYITGGVQTIIYDKNGSNPAPTMTAYSVELRENGSIVTPTTYAWSVPASGSLLSGSASGATFTPTVAGTFSAGSANNRVDVSVTYGAITCQATAPVAITRIGADGLPAEAENKQQLYARLGVGTTGDVLNTQCGIGDAAAFAGRTVRVGSGDVHRTDLCGGSTWIHALSTDTATTPKFGIKSSAGTPLVQFNADGSFTGTLVIR